MYSTSLCLAGITYQGQWWSILSTHLPDTAREQIKENMRKDLYCFKEGDTIGKEKYLWFSYMSHAEQ